MRTLFAHSMALLGVLLMLVVATAPALAAGRYALVVANAKYEGAPLANPEIDLKLVVPALIEMGFEVEQVANADLREFDLALNRFAERSKNADIALFYFAGHGFSLADGISSASYLMSTDADVTNASDRVIQAGGIRLDSIISQLTGSARTTLVFVDACRNDPRVGRNTGGGQGRGFSAISEVAQGDVFVGLSTRLGKIAADGNPGQGSPFARAFVEHIGEPGLNIYLAFNKVRLAVEATTIGVQSPEANRSDLRNPEAIILRAALGDDRTRTKQAARLWETIEDSNSLAMLEKFATDFNGTLYADYARVRIEELRAAQQQPVVPVEPEDPQPKDVVVADIEDVGPTQPDPLEASRLAIYQGLDFYGGDIASRRERDAVQCASSCLQNGQCRAFTFNTRTNSGPNCFLKFGVDRLEAYDGALGGVILRPGSPEPKTLSFAAIDPTDDLFPRTDITGHDISQSPWPRASTVGECRAACINNDQCQAFSFASGPKQCWLKHTVGEMVTRSNVVTGIKRQVSFDVTEVLTLD